MRIMQRISDCIKMKRDDQNKIERCSEETEVTATLKMTEENVS